MKKEVIGVFHDSVKADHALQQLIDAGFNGDDLSLMVAENSRNRHFEIDTTKTKTAEGVGLGAVLGGLAAGLTALAIPGGLFAAGPIVGAFASGGVGAASGGLIGGLIGLGIAEDEAKLTANNVKEGAILLAATAADSQRASQAKSILKENGADRVH